MMIDRSVVSAFLKRRMVARLGTVYRFSLPWRPSVGGISVCVVRRQDRHFPNCSLCEPGQAAELIILFEILLRDTSSSGIFPMGGFSLLCSLAFSS